MVYKRNKHVILEWREFQKNFAPKLIELGIPSSIVSSESRWWYLLEHGDEFQSAWSPLQLDKQRAKKLIQLLREKYQNGEATCLVQKLEKKTSAV